MMRIESVVNPTVLRCKVVALALLTALLSACQPSPVVESNLNFKPPGRILQVRAIDRSQLRPVVQLSNGVNIPMQLTGDNTWNGSINVQPDNTYFVTVEWIESMPEGDLVLGQWAQSIDVDADGAEIVLSDQNYDYSVDSDGDGISNLNERQNNTNPFVHNDQSNAGEGNSDGSVDAGNTTSTDSTLGEGDTGSNTGGTMDTAGSTSGSTGSDSAGTDSDTNTDSGNTDSGNTDSGNTGFGTTDSDSTDTAGTTDSGQTTAGSTTGTSIGVTTSGDSDDGGDTVDVHTKATVLVPRIASNSAPVINGLGVTFNAQDNLTGEWKDAVQFDDAGERLWIDNLMIDRGADAEDGAQLRRWAALHDGEYLYVLVLSDDVGARQADSLDYWQDDTLELFIDGNNSKLNSWGDADDFHLLIPLLKQNSTNKIGNNEIDGRFTTGPGSVDANLNVEFFTGPGVGPDGIRIERFEQDVYELAIPLSSAGIVVGTSFGFELQIDDDDDGGERDSKWGWFHPSRTNNVDTDTTYLDPSIMGTVVLEE